MIRITVNGEARNAKAGASVTELLQELGLNPLLVVVEQNREILARARVADAVLSAGDVLEVVHFVGGG
jgi:thiamine biosynthesis protein ThiS